LEVDDSNQAAITIGDFDSEICRSKILDSVALFSNSNGFSRSVGDFASVSPERSARFEVSVNTGPSHLVAETHLLSASENEGSSLLWPSNWMLTSKRFLESDTSLGSDGLFDSVMEDGTPILIPSLAFAVSSPLSASICWSNATQINQQSADFDSGSSFLVTNVLPPSDAFVSPRYESSHSVPASDALIFTDGFPMSNILETFILRRSVLVEVSHVDPATSVWTDASQFEGSDDLSESLLFSKTISNSFSDDVDFSVEPSTSKIFFGIRGGCCVPSFDSD
jgi:hypothetical protein